MQWAKTNVALNALLAGRVASNLPAGFGNPEAGVGASFLRVFSIDGDPDGVFEEAVVGRAQLQWDAYAYNETLTKPDYATASLIARTLVQEAKAAVGVIVAGQGVLISADQISGPRRIDEAETNWARYQADLRIALRGGSS